MEIKIIVIGCIMFISGLIMFYSIELGQIDPALRTIKNIGTFIGLGGMGVVLAGILLYVINRSELPMAETSGV